MPMSPDQRKTMQVAAGFGYKVNTNGVKVESFKQGDVAIVLTNKGEPIMSGAIEEIRLPTEFEQGAIRLGDRWYYADQHFFRHG